MRRNLKAGEGKFELSPEILEQLEGRTKFPKYLLNPPDAHSYWPRVHPDIDPMFSKYNVKSNQEIEINNSLDELNATQAANMAAAGNAINDETENIDANMDYDDDDDDVDDNADDNDDDDVDDQEDDDENESDDDNEDDYEDEDEDDDNDSYDEDEAEEESGDDEDQSQRKPSR